MTQILKIELSENLTAGPPQARAVYECDLSYESILSRGLVHRTAVSEVFLTDFRVLDEGRAIAAAQWPRGHRIYRASAGRPDTMLIAETVRQAGIHAASSMLGRKTDRIVMDELLVDQGGATGTDVVTDVLLDISLSEGKRRTRHCCGFSIDVDFRSNGELVAQGVGKARCLDPRVYSRIRGQIDLSSPQEVCPVEHGLIGMGFEEDVVIGHPGISSGGVRRWPLRVLPDHPILFDHPLDHVPGMLVLEAFRQVARLETGWPTATTVAFELQAHQFVELSAPAYVELRDASVLENGQVEHRLELRQDTRLCASIRMRSEAEPPRPDFAAAPGYPITSQ